ncbi:MAG: winged helix-turn-helix domain-containing protein [Candidatus Sericytochromatia bacterium]|nr:winged helix-turn-helix domain-containing protein [Candidatus Sericytochromatia bacterium]
MELWSIGAAQHLRHTLSQAARRLGWAYLPVTDWKELGRLRPDTHRPTVGHVHLPGDAMEASSHLAARIRSGALPQGPVLVTLDHQSSTVRHLAWATGCSEVLAPPFEERELLARLEGLGRRAQRLRPRNVLPDQVQPCPWIHVLDRPIHLTPSEASILSYLARRPGQHVRVHELLSGALCYTPGEGHPDIIRTHVRRLRAKLGAARHAITTRAGHGYRWDPEAGVSLKQGLPRTMGPGETPYLA